MVKLEIVLGEAVPSFKNRKHSGKSGFVYTEPKIKARMQELESAIAFALYSAFPMGENETVSEWQKRRATALSGLCDDSLKEIPEFSFGVEYVEKGQEGVTIEIEEI